MKRHTKPLLLPLSIFLSSLIILLLAHSRSGKLVQAQEDVFTNIAYPIHINLTDNDIKGGSIVSLKDTGYTLSSVDNDEDMIGVLNDAPGVFYQGDVESQNAYLVSGGTSYVLVDTTNGPILKGDHITSSKSPGIGVKATQSGRVIGRALESYDSTGIGKISANIKSEIFEVHPNRINTGTSSNYSFPIWWYVLAIVILVSAVISGFFLLRRSLKQ